MRIKVTFGFCAIVCFLAWLNGRLCLFFLIAAAFHELGHLIVLLLLHVPVHGLTVSCSGAQIHCVLDSDPKEAVCALAGPLFNVLIGCVFLRLEPELSIISFCLAAVNLLPLYPLDGGRILLCMLRVFLPMERAEKAASVLQFLVCSTLMMGACWAAAEFKAGLWPVFAALTILWKAGNQERLLQFLHWEDKMKQSDYEK